MSQRLKKSAIDPIDIDARTPGMRLSDNPLYPMNATPRNIQVFKYNPPLKVLSRIDDSNRLESEDYLFARPKLKRHIAHDRVSRYFRKSGFSAKSQLD